MIELLALPEWNTSPTRLEVWLSALEQAGAKPQSERESTGVVWIESTSLRFRGYAVMQGGDVEAINFELHDSDPGPARAVLEKACATIAWALHDEDDEPEDIEDD